MLDFEWYEKMLFHHQYGGETRSRVSAVYSELQLEEQFYSTALIILGINYLSSYSYSKRLQLQH